MSHSRKKTIKTKVKVKKGCIHLGLFESVDSIHSFMIIFHYFLQYVPIRSQVPLKTWCLNPPCSDPLGRAPWVWAVGSNATRPWEVIVPASGGTRPLICTLEISYSRYFQVKDGKRCTHDQSDGKDLEGSCGCKNLVGPRRFNNFNLSENQLGLPFQLPMGS